MNDYDKRVFLESEAGDWVRERIAKQRAAAFSRFNTKGTMEEIYALRVLDRLAIEMAGGENVVDIETTEK